MQIKGSDLVVQELIRQGVEDFFHVIGGPMTSVIISAIAAGINDVGVRDERAGAYAAIAYSRHSLRPGIVMTCSGPGTINTVLGVAHAQADGAPLIILGGSASTFKRSTGLFQETDQVSVMRPITKWAHQVTSVEEIPDVVARAFQVAMSGAPGPVYLDLPPDALYGECAQDDLYSKAWGPRPLNRPFGDPALIKAAVDCLQQAQRPVLISGSGVLWSSAEKELKDFVESAGIPFYTTPIAAGSIPEDHALSFPAARSTAFREADCIFVVGTRDNYVVNFLQPPVIGADCKVVELNINSDDLSHNRVADVAILADAKVALGQLVEEIERRAKTLSHDTWASQLKEIDQRSRLRNEQDYQTDEGSVHPFTLASHLRRLAPRDAILVVDGRETLAFGRRGMAAYVRSGFLNPGTYGTMGVGVPFAIGAKLAAPSQPVIAMVGDGAFGYHVMEIETAIRNGIGFLCAISNNGSWTGTRQRPGHALSFADYHHLSEVFGCWGAKVSETSELDGAIEEALKYVNAENKPAILNVITTAARAESRPRDFRLSGAKDEYAET